jgi:rhamnulokinase
MSPRSVRVGAVDLGAASGRVMLARVGPDELALAEVYRFPNQPVTVGGTLHWDVLALYRGLLDGLAAAARPANRGLDGIGIDSWGVDYGLLDADGALVGNPVSYRDRRTDGVMARVLAELGAADVYAVTGIQNLPFNTIFQLAAARGGAGSAAARRLLLIPDLLGYWLTGSIGAEVTNASTTQLLDVRTRQWSADLTARLGLRPDLLPPLRAAGDLLGVLRPEVAAATGLGPVPVIAVGSHDTASAVVGVPADGERFAYISCGTWSLVGVELTAPVLTEASQAANFTNESGVDGTIRYLRNVMGLWLLQESLRSWAAAGFPVDLDRVLAEAVAEPAFVSVVNPDDPVYLPPGDQPGRIAAACRRTGQPVPSGPAATVRCILDSLALAHRRAVRDAERLSGHAVEVVHIVGGGSRNALLCQLTADACGLPVLAGPVEATAWGNALVQARTLGAVAGGLTDLRDRLRRHVVPAGYTPRRPSSDWDEIDARTPRS